MNPGQLKHLPRILCLWLRLKRGSGVQAPPRLCFVGFRKRIADWIRLHYGSVVPPSGLIGFVRRYELTVRSLFSVLVLAAFMSLQLASSAHAHETHHDEPDPSHSVCDICVVAASEEDVLIVAAIDPPPRHDGNVVDFIDQLQALSLPAAATAPGFEALQSGQAPPRDPDRRLDAARAPPK